ncbi:MAG: hypothetical protein HOP12_06200 [Candidatus Eisenbacteria bacterium]|uniref:Phosphodiester glycosidase domain-containing protein n=1 Tax=Eiseniibacteriota bacterium TaxID=2212470 RepID=A0A849SLN1_UNCEI|nr:hypothetical protein [Candidatus Eisenbacteria bacterium]
MKRGRWPVTRLALLAALLVGGWVLLQGVRAPRWHSVAPGVEFATLHGDPYCRSGSINIAVLRLDPQRVRIRMRHFLREPDQKPLRLDQWMARSPALAAFNAGQYYPDLSYMGVFVSGGEVVSGTEHPSFRAALVAEPRSDTTANARVLDLDHDPLDPKRTQWGEVAQSFMLFERGGMPRVRHTDQVALRTVVGEDGRGRILIITSEGGYTLWDFATLLNRAPLELVHALSMDGGREAQLAVRTESFRYANYGPWNQGEERPEGARNMVPLPAVVTVEAR